MDEGLPEWAGRQVIAQAVQACGLPFVPWALLRRPPAAATYAEQVLAIELSIRVVAEARRRLPRGVSGAMFDRGWRDAAWRCIVAGLAMLDDEERARLVADEPEEQEAEPVIASKAEPRREPQASPPAAAPVTFRIYRAGEVPHAS